jgi:hypothetical protein
VGSPCKGQGQAHIAVVGGNDPEQIVASVNFRYIADVIMPAEELGILRKGTEGQAGTVKVKLAHLIKTSQTVTFTQDPPDDPITTIAIKCDGEPGQDTMFVRNHKPHGSV